MNKFKLLEIELPSLRNEMLEVKKCQHQLFIFEIVATGAIVGFLLPCITTILRGIHFWPTLFFLSPLVIIIPSQYLILDKAITVNRICSYIKVIEQRIAFEIPIRNEFFAWENGCAEFRHQINELKPAQKSSNPTQGPNHFYMLIFITTAIITSILLFLMIVFYVFTTNIKEVNSAEIVVMVGLLIVTIITVAHQYTKLMEVLEGKLTIIAMADLWDKIV